MSERVNHPPHYGGDTTYEAIKVIEAWGLGFCLGNAVKYICRAGHKDPARQIEDLRKAIWYIERKIAQQLNGLGDRRLQPDECRIHHIQACSTCPDFACVDNTNPAKEVE